MTLQLRIDSEAEREQLSQFFPGMAMDKYTGDWMYPLKTPLNYEETYREEGSNDEVRCGLRIGWLNAPEALHLTIQGRRHTWPETKERLEAQWGIKGVVESSLKTPWDGCEEVRLKSMAKFPSTRGLAAQVLQKFLFDEDDNTKDSEKYDWTIKSVERTDITELFVGNPDEVFTTNEVTERVFCRVDAPTEAWLEIRTIVAQKLEDAEMVERHGADRWQWSERQRRLQRIDEIRWEAKVEFEAAVMSIQRRLDAIRKLGGEYEVKEGEGEALRELRVTFGDVTYSASVVFDDFTALYEFEFDTFPPDGRFDPDLDDFGEAVVTTQFARSSR